MSRKTVQAPKAHGGAHLKAPSTTETSGSASNQYPVFCLRYLENLDSCEKYEQAALVKTLRDLARQTWQQLYARGKHSGGCETIPKGSLKGVRLADLPQGHESVLAFRFQGKKPVLGFKEGAVFRLLHLDRNFSAYDHGS